MKNWRFRPISRFISGTIQDLARVTVEDEYQMVPFSIRLNVPNTHFKVTPIFDAEYVSNGTR